MKGTGFSLSLFVSLEGLWWGYGDISDVVFILKYTLYITYICIYENMVLLIESALLSLSLGVTFLLTRFFV